MSEWKRSGETGAEFSARHALKEATLRHWAWQLKSEARHAKTAAPVPAFIEVSAPKEREGFEVELGGGVKLKVPAEFDAVALKKLLAVLEGR